LKARYCAEPFFAATANASAQTLEQGRGCRDMLAAVHFYLCNRFKHGSIAYRTFGVAIPCFSYAVLCAELGGCSSYKALGFGPTKALGAGIYYSCGSIAHCLLCVSSHSRTWILQFR
jgi:hypothetical protein